jgi:hypothetical protein
MSRREAIMLGVVLVVAAAVYAPVLEHPFISYDDPAYVSENPHVQGGFTRQSVRWAFTTTEMGNWHPLTWLSHMLDGDLYGPWLDKPAPDTPAFEGWHALCRAALYVPNLIRGSLDYPPLPTTPTVAGCHLMTSVLLHLGSTLLLFLALRRMTLAPWPSAVVAGLFALHPLHVESVAWVAERKDVLCGFFEMAALLAYAHYVRRVAAIGTRGRAGAVLMGLVVLVCFALALMSKPMAVTFPLVLLLLDYWPLGRCSWGALAPSALPGAPAEAAARGGRRGRRPRAGQPPLLEDNRTLSRMPPLWLILEKLPLLALSAASCVVTYLAQRDLGTMTFLADVGFRERLGGAAIACVRYLGKAVWPDNLAVIYPYDRNLASFWGLPAAVVLVALTVLVVRRGRRQPWLLVGWLWFLGTLVPVLGLVQVGAQSMADRYTYVPLIGIFMAAAWGVAAWSAAAPRPWRPWAAGAVAAAALVACAGATAVQVGTWKDSIHLFSHAVMVTGDNAVAANNLAAELPDDLGEDAIGLLTRAVEIKPDYADAQANLGIRLLVRGRPGDTAGAIDHLEKAAGRRPDQPTYHYNLAQAYAVARRYEEAVAQYHLALGLRPDFPLARRGLAAARAALGRVEKTP